MDFVEMDNRNCQQRGDGNVAESDGCVRRVPMPAMFTADG